LWVPGGQPRHYGVRGVYAAPSVKYLVVVARSMFPPQTIILWPVHTATGSARPGSGEAGRALHRLVAGL
jgi:hypothetical protein